MPVKWNRLGEMKEITLFVLLGSIALFIPGVFAESGTNVQQPVKAVTQSSELNLSIPEKDLEDKMDAANNNLNNTKSEESKTEYCEDLLRQVNDLRGKLKPISRDVLIKRHEIDCLNSK